ncbi:hypothetical protein [Cupriavidus sp. 8B]
MEEEVAPSLARIGFAWRLIGPLLPGNVPILVGHRHEYDWR